LNFGTKNRDLWTKEREKEECFQLIYGFPKSPLKKHEYKFLCVFFRGGGILSFFKPKKWKILEFFFLPSVNSTTSAIFWD
jgi:hypothetical protein